MSPLQSVLDVEAERNVGERGCVSAKYNATGLGWKPPNISGGIVVRKASGSGYA